jgi:hypothetical protein
LAEAGRDSDRGACTVHAENEAVGTCQRCGNFLCRVCRTRWEGRGLCLNCVQRALEDQEWGSEETRAHRRQARLSLVFGLIAWGLVLVSVLTLVLAGVGSAAAGLVILAGLLIILSFVPAVFGVGQGAAAVRTRGDRMIIGAWGLVLCSCHLGVISGLLLLAVWRQ